MKGSVVLLAAAAIAVASLWIGSAVAASSSMSIASDGSCTVTATRWTDAGQTGTKYLVRTRGGVTCGFVKLWVPRVARQHLIQIGGAGVVKGGPAGWTCKATSIRYYGTCYLTSNPGKAFFWLPKK
jgi:hypothetical protein